MTNITATFRKAKNPAKVAAVSGLAMLSAACASTAQYATEITAPTIDRAGGCAITQTQRLIEDRGGETSVLNEERIVTGYDAECLQAERDILVARGMATAFYQTTFEQSSDPQQVKTYGEAILAAFYGDNPIARQAVESVLRENNIDQGDIAIRVNEARRQMEEVIRPTDCTERRGVMPNGEEVTYNDCRTITGSLDTRQWNPTSIRIGSNLG